jgi:hypothetical protein
MSRSLDYYRFLARVVAPPSLAAAAARRAVRSARNRFLPTLELEDDRLLAALSCRDPGDAAALLSRARPAPPPWSPETLRTALDRHLPGEVEKALARAREAARGWFHVYGRMVPATVSGRVDWQRDFVHGGRFAGGAPSGRLPLEPGLDPKMAWSLARGEPWVAMACGAALEEDRSLAEALSRSVADFVRANPVGRGVHWASAMEAGIRAWNLVVALWVLSIRGPPDPALAVAALRLLVSSGRFIRAHLEDDTAVPNNHLTCDWLGLLACAEALPEWPESSRWRTLALEGLRRAARDQVLADGLAFEGSLPYHRFSLELLAAGALLAHASRRGLGRAYASRLHAMFRATRALLAQSGELPQLGDNDSGHVLAVRQRGPTEGGYLLSLGAALFRDPALLVRRGADDAAEVAWLLGPGALRFLAAARPGPTPRSAAFPRGGFHAIRRGPIEAFFSCGPNGQRGIGGHSHNDKLGLELFVAGARAVSDPGMPVYGRDPALRDRFRSTSAHATVTVDGLEQSPIPAGRIFALPDRAAARLLLLESGPAGDHLAGEHAGFAARAGIVHRRDLWVTADGALVLDLLQGAGLHAVRMRWPLAASRIRPRPAAPEERRRLAALARLAPHAPALDLDRAVEIPLEPAGWLVLVMGGPTRLDSKIVETCRSPGYGQLRPAVAVELRGSVACPARLASAFLHVPAR